MKLVKLKSSKLDETYKIIEDAIAFLADQKIDQWQDNYPNLNTLENDIKNDSAFALIDSDDNILAYASISLEKEFLYEEIETWKCNNKYAILHRTAVNANYRNMGIFKNLISESSSYLKNLNVDCIRIDTHPDNKLMIKALKSCGFIKVGSMVYDQGIRLAFELCL